MTKHAQTETSGVLDGIIVADFSRVLAGPYATMMLADMGATVIKVESPGGDDTRAWQPPVRDEQSTYFLSVNRNKQAIALDLKDDDDLAAAHKLLAKADVFIENFKPGGLTKFNMDPDSVAQRYPHLVHASITGFGTTGGAHLPGYDLLAQAASGLMDITGEPESQGQKAGVAIFDVVTGLHATVGILGALQERNRSGKGQHVAVNLMSSALSGLVNQTSAYVAGGVVPTRMGNDHPSLAPYGPFAASDQPLIIAVGNDTQFRRLVDALGASELADDERYATNPARNQHRDHLRTELERHLQHKTASGWVEELRELGIPCSEVFSIAQGVDFADEIGLEPVQPAGAEQIPTIKHPVDYSRSPVAYDKAPPTLNQDRQSILDWLNSES
ncbi:CaiB/BaiF CoA transferase family protein [Yaniella halotolerans]|uniref:CaiB/BaiF CoA transferase family protein n=1 Tax=Yaniella halotolerans TaxID=225453 RepID=UPI0003FA28AE|nr:CoA transferase [Yaniella halotolerans]